MAMRGSRIFFRGGGGGGGGGRPDGQISVWTMFFSPQLILQFTEGFQWFYYRENYTFPGPTFSRGGGVQLSLGGSKC